MKPRTPLGEYLKETRKTRNETMQDMADNVDVVHSYLSTLETGKIGLSENVKQKFIESYGLSDNETKLLEHLINMSLPTIKINMEGKSNLQRQWIYAFYMMCEEDFKNISSDDQYELERILDKYARVCCNDTK